MKRTRATSHRGRARRRWAQGALVCVSALQLFVPSVRGRASSITASFIGPSCQWENKRCGPTARFSTQVEEEASRSMREEETIQRDVPDETPLSASVTITNMDELLHIPFPDRNGHSQLHNGSNGHAKHHNSRPRPVSLAHELPEENGEENGNSQPPTLRKLWQRRHARSIEEGVRMEKIQEKATQLSRLLSRAPLSQGPQPKRFFARTISGLINALAEEVDGLEVDVDAREGTPIWRKQFDAVRINFSRLGFKPLKMGGLDEAIRSFETQVPESHVEKITQDLELSAVESADEAFDRIDEDNSGSLDPEEIAKALNLAASSDSEDKKLLDELAEQLVELYDLNGDGVVDREEYQRLVADMATLRQVEHDRPEKENGHVDTAGWFQKAARWLWRKEDEREAEVTFEEVFVENVANITDITKNKLNGSDDVVNISDDEAVNSVARGGGSIVLEGLKMDLRQLIFGVVPVVKRITPGGHLILEPFTATVSGSFNKDDILASHLLDAALRRLAARALRRRVRGFRDLLDGAVFSGRKWTMASKSAPMVEVPELTSVEFDKENRIIMTGRAQVRTSPSSLLMENTFKLRTKIGTRSDGQCIRLVEPELAFVLECPRSWEKNIRLFIGSAGLPIPPRPQPLYSFFPIYSPFKVNDDDGYYIGEDNRIKSLKIKDGALHFELRAILRPGRFLGNHYLAFTVPQRTFIITMDRVREGIRAARTNKRAAEARAKEKATSERKNKGRNYLDVVAQSLSSQELVDDGSKFRLADTKPTKKMVALPRQPPHGNKSFFSRFVDGYLGAGKDENENHQRLTSAISDWFGKQKVSITTVEATDNKKPSNRKQAAV